MNKTKKGLLTAGSIITILACALAILMSVFMFLMAKVIDEEIFIEIYKEDSILTYYEDENGNYYFSGMDEDGEEIVIKEVEVESVVKMVKTVFIIFGVVDLSFAIAKLILAIKLLNSNSRDKKVRGYALALFILSILTMNLIESILFLIAICVKDDYGNKEKPLGLNDIIIDDQNISNE